MKKISKKIFKQLNNWIKELEMFIGKEDVEGFAWVPWAVDMTDCIIDIYKGFNKFSEIINKITNMEKDNKEEKPMLIKENILEEMFS